MNGVKWVLCISSSLCRSANTHTRTRHHSIWHVLCKNLLPSHENYLKVSNLWRPTALCWLGISGTFNVGYAWWINEMHFIYRHGHKHWDWHLNFQIFSFVFSLLRWCRSSYSVTAAKVISQLFSRFSELTT